ncbi:hypothetical protein D9619_012285 [Psilocybe cf. subviscida]|uniref:CCHC-type domain-containing protein n=1 Tax=Psilocybe cf. subviscida TaxID=2480587 RepID=A0A8H5EZJ8_9AGAR|nr:hypothetical protein D9619_012285 [Psilocybe cf. subviscida]
MAAWPLRNTRNAPIFTGENAEVLPRYIEDIEALLEEHKTNTDEEKKAKLTHYADPKIERQWKTLPTYEDQKATFEDFKEEVLADYSEVECLKTGNRQRLEAVVRRYSGLRACDLSELQAYKREFTAEYTLLGDLLSNQTLVELFVSSLDQRFKEHVWSALSVVDVTREELMAGIKAANKTNKDLNFPAENTRRMDDRFEIKKVMGKAIELARQTAPIPGERKWRADTPAHPVLDSLAPKTESLVLQRLEAQEGLIAQLKDAMLLSQKQQSELVTTLKKSQENGSAQFQQSQDNGTTDTRGQRQDNDAPPGNPDRYQDSRRDRSHNDGKPHYNRSREDDRPHNNQYGGGGGNRDYGQGSNNYGQGSSNYRRNNSRNDDECRYCGIAGHFVAHCRIRREDEDRSLCQYRNYKIYLPNDEVVLFDPNHPMRKIVMDYHRMEKESSPQSQLYHDPDYQGEDADEHARLRKTLCDMEFECMFGGTNTTSAQTKPVAPKPAAKSEMQDELQYLRTAVMTMLQNQNSSMQTRSKGGSKQDFQ